MSASGLAVAHLGPILVVAELISSPSGPQVGQVLPDGVLQLGGMLGGHAAVDLEEVRRAALVAAQLQPDAGDLRRCFSSR